jgi:hypothetical protein
VLLLLILRNALLFVAYLENFIFNLIEVPERKDNKMTPLRVSTADPVYDLLMIVVDLKLLKFLV